MKEIHIINNDGEVTETFDASAYAKHILSENDVPDMTWEEGDVTKTLEARDVVTNLVKWAFSEKDLKDSPTLEPYRDLFSSMQEDVKASKAHASAEKEEKAKQKKEEKEKKEKEKKEKEEKAAELAKAQEIFGDQAVVGFEKATDDFKSEVENLGAGLPEGFTITAEGQGCRLDVSENATAESMGEGLGYLMAQEHNTTVKASVLQFLVGDAANAATALGLYKSMIQAGKAISEKVKEKTGKSLSPRNIESYARMAYRIPTELRNPNVDVTAYLELANSPSINPRKGVYKVTREEGESKKDYEERVKEVEDKSNKYEKERLEIAKKLAKGYLEKEVEVDGKKKKVKKDITSRKDVIPLVNDLKVEWGFKEKEDPGKKSKGEWLIRYFYADFLINKFDGVHEDGKIMTHDPDSEATVITREVGDLVDLKEQAEGNLINMLFGDDLEALLSGEAEYDKVVMDDGKPKKDKDGKTVTEKATKKVYPKDIFS